MEMIRNIDLQLFRLINSEWTSPGMDRFMALVSDFGFWMYPLLIGALFLVIFGKFRERALVVLVALALLVGDAGIVQGIRAVVDRPRPWQALENVRYVNLSGVEIRGPTDWEHGRSMPSGHVCNNTAAAVIVTLLYGLRPWGILIWIWAGLVSYSRIYTGSHYLSDVLVSIPLAMLYAWLICGAANFLWNKYAPRLLPSLHSKHPTLFPPKNPCDIFKIAKVNKN